MFIKFAKDLRNYSAHGLLRDKTIATLLVFGSCCALFLHAATAVAQQAQAADEEEAVEEIVVMGQNLARQRAIASKRETDNILDAIAQDDIGRLPDLNTAAALRRIPGISIQNDQGEPRFPVVRGLQSTFNRTAVDGAIVPSPERNTRTVPLDIIPASLISRLEVYKTLTPDMDANSVGGTVNVVTKSSFERGGEAFLIGGAFIGSHENSGDGGTLFGQPGGEKQPWRANIAAGTRFGSNDEFGVVAGFDYSIRNFEIPQIEVDDADYTEFDGGLNNVGLGSGNGIVVPTNKRLFWYNNVRERIGGHAKLEWQPTDELHLSLSGLFSQFNDDERRDEVRYELGSGTGSNTPATLTAQTATTSTSDEGFTISGIGRFVINREIWNSIAKVEWEPASGPRWDASLIFGGGSLNNPEVTEAFQSSPVNDFTFDHAGFFPQVIPADPGASNDLSTFAHVNRGVLDRGADEDVIEFNTNLEWDFDLLDSPATLKVGGVFRNTERNEGFTFNRFVVNVPYTLDQVADTTLAGAGFPQDGDSIDFRIDRDASDEFFAQNRNDFTRSLLLIRATDYDEDVLAGYAQLNFNPGDNLNVIAGVRVEDTDWEGGNLDAPGRIEGNYTDVLPGLHVRYDLRDDIVLRAAYSETISRANPSDLTLGESVTIETDGSITVFRSNPDLDPRHSTNLDLSVEWYVPEGILAVGVFFKDVEDNIFRVTSQDVMIDIGNGPELVDSLTQPENAADSEMTGFEIQYQQRLYFLPGALENLGVSFNGTFIDGDMTIPTSTGTRDLSFFQQPETVVNAMAYYAAETFEIRLSYNYTDGFLDTVNANNPDKDEYWLSRETYDFQARYNFTDNISGVFEVVNLSDSERTEVSGPGGSSSNGFLQESANFGRTFWLGATFSL